MNSEFIETITEEWILSQMEELGLKRKDLKQDIGLDTVYLSLFFAKEDNPRKIHLSKTTKAMFYYYFEWKRSTLAMMYPQS